MYLIMNGQRYTCSKRIHTKNTIKFLSVTPKPETISGTAKLYRDDGFLLSEDDLDGYERTNYCGTLLTVTNEPERKVENHAANPNYRISMLENIIADMDKMTVEQEYKLTLLELDISE